MNSSRILWIDLLKALTMLAVVWGHQMSCGAFEAEIGPWVYSRLILPWHMPLFALLSGWFFRVGEKDTFLRSRLTGILLPYAVWCLLWFVIRPMMVQLLSGDPFPLSSLRWYMGYYLEDVLCRQGWWFLRGILLCHLVAWTSVRLCCGRRGVAAGLSILLVYGLSLSGILPNMPDKDSLLKGFIYLYPFFWTGVLLRHTESWWSGRVRWLLPLMALAGLLCLLVWRGENAFYGMNTALFAVQGIQGGELLFQILFRYFTGAVLSFILILFCYGYKPRMEKMISVVGSNTLGIYVLQSLVFWSMPTEPFLAHLPPVWAFLLSLLFSLIIILLSVCIVLFFSRSNLLAMILFGKRKKGKWSEETVPEKEL